MTPLSAMDLDTPGVYAGRLVYFDEVQPDVVDEGARMEYLMSITRAPAAYASEEEDVDSTSSGEDTESEEERDEEEEARARERAPLTPAELERFRRMMEQEQQEVEEEAAAAEPSRTAAAGSDRMRDLEMIADHLDHANVDAPPDLVELAYDRNDGDLVNAIMNLAEPVFQRQLEHELAERQAEEEQAAPDEHEWYYRRQREMQEEDEQARARERARNEQDSTYARYRNLVELARQEAEDSVSRRFLLQLPRDVQAALQRPLGEERLAGERHDFSRARPLQPSWSAREALSERSWAHQVHIPDRQQEDAFEDEPTYTDADATEDLAELSRTARESIEETARMPMSRGADGPRLGKSARAREVAKVIYRLLLTKEMETLQEQVDNEVINEWTFKERADAIMHKYNCVRVDPNLIVHHGGPAVRIEWEPPASEIPDAD